MEKSYTSAKPVIPILIALSLTHFINDFLQSTLMATFPILREDMSLTFAQIGTISLVYQFAASVFQPLVGVFFDKRPFPYSLPLATTLTMLGIICLSFVPSVEWVYIAVFIIGMGSSIIHPESSRITSLASMGKRGLAQSIFQVGGNLGGSIGPLIVALVVAPVGRGNLMWFVLFSIASYCVTTPVVIWFKKYIHQLKSKSVTLERKPLPLSLRKTVFVVGILTLLIISKYIYLESLRSYYTFYLIEHFKVSISASQICLFVFLFSTAAGTLCGGPIGDRIGRKYVIWLSILGTAPFSLLLPHVDFVWTIVLSFCAGFMLSSAFPAILLYAQELLPNKLGLVSGVFFGFAFGIGGIASAILGYYIDMYGIETIYNIVAWTPLMGIIAVLLPNLKYR